MKLIVYRGAEFVSHLQIELVDLNSAAGVIVSKRLEPRPDDKVKTEVKPRDNVYTVLLVVVVLSLGFTLGWVLWHLMSAPPVGCGMKLGDLFEPLKQL